MNSFQIKSRLDRTARSPYKSANRITATRKKNRNGFSFSEGFIRRMTEPLTFTFVTATSDMKKRKPNLYLKMRSLNYSLHHNVQLTQPYNTCSILFWFKKDIKIFI